MLMAKMIDFVQHTHNDDVTPTFTCYIVARSTTKQDEFMFVNIYDSC